MPKLKYSNADAQKLFEQIFAGDVTPVDLPAGLYTAIADFIKRGLYKGYGETISSVEFGTPDAELITALRENVYMFSAAKTFQQTVEMSEALTNEEGEVVSKSDFIASAREIFTRYNGTIEGEADETEIKDGWISSEYDTAISQGFNAKKWEQIDRQKDVLPYVMRTAVEDEVLCEICGELDGICLPVDDPFWDENGGCSHFGCRCIFEQIEQEEGEDKEWDDEEVEAAVEAADVPQEFRMNPGRSGEVFKAEGAGAHPYFTVPKEYTKFAKENFGLTIPETD